MIQSIRFGFATNSSSSHSVVLTDNPFRSAQEVVEALHPDSFSHFDFSFGWEFETYTNTTAIVAYAYCLYLRYCDEIEEMKGDWEEALEKSNFFEETKVILRLIGPDPKGCGIDHQSNESHEGAVGNPEQDFWDFVIRCTEIETGNDNN